MKEDSVKKDRMEKERTDEGLLKDTEPEREKRKKKKNGGGTAAGGRILLHLLQHISFVLAVVLGISVIYGSYIRVNTRKDQQYYNLHEEQNGVTFEQSRIFNDILGKGITDIICYGAIRGQMETDGKFDAKKKVDVTAFAERYEGTASEYITANYYLEDLLKWAKNGFEYEDVFMTGEEADHFLSRKNIVTTVNYGDEYSGGIISYLNSDLESVTKVVDVSGNFLDSEENIREDVQATVLNNRYHTIDKKSIEDHVASWDEYYQLCMNVRKAAEDLNINYEEYLECQEYYDEGGSNLVYFIRRTIGDEVQIFTNLDTKATDLRTLKKEVDELCSDYVYYAPQTMEYDTNTLIEEETLRYVLNGYEYAYPENTQIMVGVRDTYIAKDAFLAARDSFDNYVPNFEQNLGAAIVCGILYLLLLFVLTVWEGRVRRKESGEIVIRLHQEDKFPTELMAAVWGLLLWGFTVLCLILWDRAEWADHMTAVTLGAVMALAFSLSFSFFYYSFVRRWKAGTLWKDSLLRKCIAAIRRSVRFFYEHAGMLAKSLVPFVVVLAVNMGCPILGECLGDEIGLVIGLLAAGLFDVLIGIFLYRSAQARAMILDGIRKIQTGDTEYKVDETGLHGDELILARAVNSIGESIKEAVDTSMKDERLKADLITNVSHDIKTPLTSIINYVDLLKRQNIDHPKAKEYIEVLDAKSQRLKQLTDDLVEASKISSGNIVLHWEKINLVELLNQSIGEFSEKFQEKALGIVKDIPKGTFCIEADSRRIWRVMENLFNNIYKYAMPGTRVYIELLIREEEKQVELSVKNISAQPLKVNVEELTERFIRGDESRTTEGSGLGLSIAKNLTELQRGTFRIVMDGDLFKVTLTFPLLSNREIKQN